MKVREKISGRNVKYPNIDISKPLVNHIGPEQFYWIEEDNTPVYDARLYRLKRIEEYTDEFKYPKDFNREEDHLPIFHISYEIIQLSNNKIKKNLQDAAENWVEAGYPQRRQNRLIRKGMQNPTNSKYLAMVTWMDLIDEEETAMADALPILPTFIFTEKPE